MKFLISAMIGVTMWSNDDESVSNLGTALVAASVGAYLVKEG